MHTTLNSFRIGNVDLEVTKVLAARITVRQRDKIESGDAATMGIGIITAERWKKTRDFLVSANLLQAGTDTTQCMTTEFVKDLKIMM